MSVLVEGYMHCEYANKAAGVEFGIAQRMQKLGGQMVEDPGTSMAAFSPASYINSHQKKKNLNIRTISEFI